MSPATVTGDSTFWDKGNFRELVPACGVEANLCARLDKQRVDKLLSKCCSVFVNRIIANGRYIVRPEQLTADTVTCSWGAIGTPWVRIGI